MLEEGHINFKILKEFEKSIENLNSQVDRLKNLKKRNDEVYGRIIEGMDEIMGWKKGVLMKYRKSRTMRNTHRKKKITNKMKKLEEELRKEQERLKGEDSFRYDHKLGKLVKVIDKEPELFAEERDMPQREHEPIPREWSDHDELEEDFQKEAPPPQTRERRDEE